MPAHLRATVFCAVLLAVLSELALPAPALAANILRGKLIFLRCASCHDISRTASPKVGPNLMGVIGRKAGSLPGYAYSAAMKRHAFVWDEAMLDHWLSNPEKVVPGTAMGFEGLRRKSDRDALIAYLALKSR